MKHRSSLGLYFSVFAVFGASASTYLCSGAIALPDIASPVLFAQATAVIYVNPAIGKDSGTGQREAPLRTITQALNLARGTTLIVLAPGTYSIETGEVFPLEMKPGVTIQGEPRDRGQTVIIRGGDYFLSRSFARQNVAIVGANQAVLTGVTVTNPNPQGYGLWTESTSPTISDNTFTGSSHDGASIVGSSAPILRNNYFHQNGANGVTIHNRSRPELQENIFEQTGFGINIAQNAAPKLIGNRITQNKDGIVVQGSAEPILRNNVIDGNDRDGLVAIGQSRPNLGTSADPGNNTFLNNRAFDVNAQKSLATLPAFGNQLTARTIGRLDLAGIPASETPTINGILLSPTPSAIVPTLAPRTLNPHRPLPLPVQRIPTRSPLPQAGAEISIAAPLPQRSAPLPIARSMPVQMNTAMRSTRNPIDIRVPEPQPGIPVALIQPRQGADMPIATAFTRATMQPRRSTGLLPVPRTMPPIGNTRGSSIPIWRGGGVRSRVSQAANLGFRFRVVVQAISDIEQAQLRSVIPGAFSLRGRPVMQAGAFRDRSEADELLQVLTNRGLQAAIEPI